jgi:UDP-glucose 4-epimerase
MKALVSGGAGFIGSTLVDALTVRGDEVIAVDDLSTGREANLSAALTRGAKLIPADVRDSRSMQSILEVDRPDVVFHLAAQVDVRVSVTDPGNDVRVNVEGTVNMLEAARQAGVESFIFVSSCAVYGDPFNGRERGRTSETARRDQFPLTESAHIRPDAPYGQGKLGAEGYVALYRNLHGLRTVSLRLANVYGPRQNPVGESGVVAIFCGHLINGSRPTVFGDGLQTRDYVYVDDVVRALLAAADSDVRGEYNIGTGIETSVLEVAEALTRITGRNDFEPVLAPAHPGEIRHMALSCELARAELGWEFEVLLEEGLERTLRGRAWQPGAGTARAAVRAPQ